MTTKYLRFPDEQAWTSAATAAGFYSEPDEDGNTTLAAYTHDHAIDVVGTITRGGDVLDGWHVNFQGELPGEWEKFAVFPQNPARVWA